jgi:hypothetical protein
MAKKSFFEEKTSEETEVQKTLVKEKEEEETVKRVRYLSAPNVRLLVQRLNENNISKDDIIEMIKAPGDYGIIYYK